MTLTRKNYQYMEMCQKLSQTFSTCAKRQYFATLVDMHGHIVGVGYNGGPSGFAHCKDGGCPRHLENSPSGSNYDNCIAVHAEANALLHCDYSAHPVDLYVNGPPCFSCAKLIANSSVERVYFVSDESYSDWDKVEKFMNQAGIQLMEVV
jgi:dCMP deaminase